MNSVSTPPLDSVRPPKPVTFADVAMKLAQDGPIYAVIGLVGAMALGGHATANEVVITSMAGLLARMWPQAVQVAGKVGGHAIVLLAAGAAFAGVHACTPAAKPAAYGAELEECSRKSSTLRESVDCENFVRVRYGRPLRVLDAGAD